MNPKLKHLLKLITISKLIIIHFFLFLAALGQVLPATCLFLPQSVQAGNVLLGPSPALASTLFTLP